MAMMLYSYESSRSLRTITQLYIAFMNVTIKHYEGHRHQWNTESQWQCIRAEGLHGDDWCSAFNVLHQVAYGMSFKARVLFPDIFSDTIKDHINQLSFVGVSSVPGSQSQVKFTFSHPTFLEFFASLHLTTLFSTFPFSKGYIRYFRDTPQVVHMTFYLGLIGDIFHYNPLGASSVLKQFFLSRPDGDNQRIQLCYKYINI